MRSRPALAVLIGAVGALSTVYLAGLLAWAETPGLYPQTIIEDLVLLSFAVRIAALFAVERLRRMPSENAVVLFGADVFVVIATTATYELTGDPAFSALGREYTFSWFAAAVLTYPVPAIYFAIRRLGTGGRLAGQIPTCAAIFGILGFSLANLSGGVTSGGLSALTSEFLKSIRGGGPSIQGGVLLGAAGGVLFASLLASEAASAGSVGGPAQKLAILVGGSAFVLGLSAALLSGVSPTIAFGVPAAMASVVMLVMVRGR